MSEKITSANSIQLDAVSIIILTLGVISASTGAIFSRFAQEFAVSSIVIAFFRLLFASVLLLPLVLTRYRKSFLVITRKDVLFISLTGLFLALHFTAWITSLELTSIASSVVLVTTTPIWVVLVSKFFLKEEINRGVIIGMTISILGGIVVALSENCNVEANGFACSGIFGSLSTAVTGDILAVLGAMMAAAYLLMGKMLRKRIDLIPYTFFVYGCGAFFLLIFALISEVRSLMIVPGGTFIWLFLLALVPQSLGHGSLNYALGHISPVIVSIALLGEPIGSTIMGVIFFKEIPTPMRIFGAGMILTGLLLVILLQKPKEAVTFD